MSCLQTFHLKISCDWLLPLSGILDVVLLVVNDDTPNFTWMVHFQTWLVDPLISKSCGPFKFGQLV